MYPVLIYEEGMELPQEGTYFVVAGNGIWMHKETGVVQAFVPVDRISFLADLDAKSWVRCNLPKLPAKLVWQIKSFFKEVTDHLRTEASVTLYFNKQDQTFKVMVPQQSVSHGGVYYRRQGLIHEADMVDYLRVGTIHSHCDFGAFHSGIDQHDETDFDGLHCTFGNTHLGDFTIAASVVVNGSRLLVDPMDVLEGVECLDEQRYRLLPADSGDWLAEIQEWFQAVQTTIPITPTVERIVKGDLVEWAGDLKTVSFRSVCGEGPFTVESVTDSTVTIVTNVGLARFSEKLFRKVQE